MKAAFSKRVGTMMVALALGLLCGCASVSEHSQAYLGTPAYAPTNPAYVQVFATEPAQTKIRLGEITLTVAGNVSRADLEDRLRKAGARLGADGVFLVSDRTVIHPVIYWDYWWGYTGTSEYWQRNIVAVAFKYAS